jgi:hypothetical protein
MPAATRLRLPEVTIVAADSAYVELTVRALHLSIEQVEFGDAILFSDKAVAGPFRSERIEPLRSIAQYSRFCLAHLPDFIRTPFALVVQWDGYVTNAAAWRNAFFKYDYIGALWYGEPGDVQGVGVVGNGGFSLRSRRLMRAAQKLPPVGGFPEDRVISQVFRAELESQNGIRFAPPKVASQFSHEWRLPEGPTFGFHGTNNLTLYNRDAELAALVTALPVQAINPDKLMDMLLVCERDSALRTGRIIYGRMTGRYSSVVMKRVLTNRFGIADGERLFAGLERAFAGS